MMCNKVKVCVQTLHVCEYLKSCLVVFNVYVNLTDRQKLNGSNIRIFVLYLSYGPTPLAKVIQSVY